MALATLPMEAVAAAARKLVGLVQPLRGSPTLMLAEDSLPWNDPKLTLEQFIAAYRTRHPHSKRLEYELRYAYLDGYRLYPPTGRLRLCREFAQSKW